MTHQEKAKELVGKFYDHAKYWDCWNDEPLEKDHAKESAIIAVDEIIHTLNHDIRDLDVRGSILLDLIKYWRDVKQEIEKL